MAFFESLISLVLLTIVHYSAVYFGLCFRFEHIVINLNSCSSVVFWSLNVCGSLATMPRISLSSLLLLLWSVWLFHLPLFSCAVNKIMVWYKHLVRLAAISPSISYSLRPKESKPVCAYTLNISIYLFAHLLALFLAFISPCCCLLCEIDRLGIYLYIFFTTSFRVFFHFCVFGFHLYFVFDAEKVYGLGFLRGVYCLCMDVNSKSKCVINGYAAADTRYVPRNGMETVRLNGRTK